MESTLVHRPLHGHHKIAAAIFVGSLIVGAALVLSAELMKPERYEFHAAANPSSYIIYDRESGRAAVVDMNSKNPTAPLEH